MTDKPIDFEALKEIGAVVAVCYSSARRMHAAEVGELVPAPAGWSVASFEADAIIYRAVVAFLVGPDCALRQAVTAEPYQKKWSALVDPTSGRFISVSDGKVFATESDFLTAMRALRSFLAEAPRPTDSAAH
jgi:hypothetical protein